MAFAAQRTVPLLGVELYSPGTPTADLEIRFPLAATPSFRLLAPEFIEGYGGVTHVLSATTRQENRDTVLAFTAPGVAEMTMTISPRKSFVVLTGTLRNISGAALANAFMDFCFNANRGGGGWANLDFLPESVLDRTADGLYWHDQVAPTGALIHSAGTWKSFYADGAQAAVDADAIVMRNEAGTKSAFLMFDKPGLHAGWINNANACMHLKPRLSTSLANGETATVRGCAGITTLGTDEVWRIYQSLIASQESPP